ncbi:MAG: LLM class F420-dependent oxidoreductase, partial [Actinobacteria bacterium]|nr:LLM class F420-dependent oxidoreductase [Actinomycetota bacterium]
ILEHFCVACPWDELSDRLVDRLDGIADRAVSYFAAAQIADDPSTLAKWGEVARDVVARTGG